VGLDPSPLEEQAKLEEAGKMAEEAKKIFSTIFKVILGLVFLVLGVLAILRWWPDLLTIVKGGIGLFLVLAGIITLAIAKE
jgi:hypothetical protein